MAERGPSLVDDILNRIKELEGVKQDVDLAPVLKSGRGQPSQWRIRQTVPWDRVVEYSREREVSMEYLVNGNGPARRAGLMSAVAEEGAVYKVATDQDVVLRMAVELLEAFNTLSTAPRPDKFGQALKLLHREFLDTGNYPSAPKFQELAKLAL